MSRWWRAYDDALHDPKVQSLPPVLFKFWFNLLCVASKYDGVIPPLDELKTLLKARLDHVETHLKDLLDRGLVDNIDGHLGPHNWPERQYKSDNSTPRVKAHRKAKRNVSETPPDNRVQNTDKNDDVEDARGRETKSLIRTEAYELSDEIARLCGHDPNFPPPQWYGAPMRVETWLGDGWKREFILPAVKSALANKRDGPPKSINYFEKPIATEIAKQNQPLPQVQVIPGETVNVRSERPQAAGGLVAAADRILARMQQFDGPQDGRGVGPNVVRMLPKG